MKQHMQRQMAELKGDMRQEMQQQINELKQEVQKLQHENVMQKQEIIIQQKQIDELKTIQSL